MEKKRGRPRLAESDKLVKVSYYFPRDLLAELKVRAHETGATDSEVLRDALVRALARIEPGQAEAEGDVVIGLENTLGKVVLKAAEVWGLSPGAVVRAVLTRALPDFINEGRERAAKLEAALGDQGESPRPSPE